MGELTVIPSSQPRCIASRDDPSIPLSPTNPTPFCPDSAAGPMGCFIQEGGLFCSPLATTRGFVYSAPDSQDNQKDEVAFIPHLSFPPPPTAITNSTNGTILHQAFARLGESCTPVPLPIDSSLRSLVTWAALKSIEKAAHSSPFGLGQGADAGTWFVYRSDCEQGTYCDQTSQDNSSTRVCKEQLPNYHTCTSYMQCLSLRCDTLEAERSAVAVDPRPLSLSSLSKRAVGGRALCLPRVYPRTGDNTSNRDNNSDSSSSSLTAAGFQPWMGGLLAGLAVIGGVIIFLLVRRRNRQENSRKTLIKEIERQAEEGDQLTGNKTSRDSKMTSLQEKKPTRSFSRREHGERTRSSQQQQQHGKGDPESRPSITVRSSSVHPLESNMSSFIHITPNSPQQVEPVPEVQALTSNVHTPTILTPFSTPQQEATLHGDGTLLTPAWTSGSTHTSPSSRTTPSPSTSPLLSSSINQRNSAPVSPVSPISPVSPKFGDGYIDIPGPTVPTNNRRSQRASHVHGLSHASSRKS